MALPDQLFYNTGISTYFWVITNRKSSERRGRVQLVDARDLFVKMSKSLGEKRKVISAEQIAEITRLYGEFEECDRVKILPNEAFGYLRITVERPLRLRWEVTEGTIAAVAELAALGKLESQVREALTAMLRQHIGLSSTNRDEVASKLDPELRPLGISGPMKKAVWAALAVRDELAPPVIDEKGNQVPDSELRESENVALPMEPVAYEHLVPERMESPAYQSAIDYYMRTELTPYVPDAWVDYEKTKIGYEIPVTRYFYKAIPARPLAEIDAEIRALEAEIQGLLAKVTK